MKSREDLIVGLAEDTGKVLADACDLHAAELLRLVEKSSEVTNEVDAVVDKPAREVELLAGIWALTGALNRRTP